MKYLIYRCSGGFAHNLSGLEFIISVAKKKKMKVLIDYSYSIWNTARLLDYFIINENVDIKEYNKSFETNQLMDSKYNNKYTLREILKNCNSIKKGHFYLGEIKVSCKSHFNEMLNNNKHNNDFIVYAGTGPLNSILNIKLLEKYKNDIKDKFKNLLIEKNNYISIHFRNTDIKSDINQYINSINFISKEKNIKNIFIATDDKKSINNFKEKFKNLNIFYVNDIIQVSGNLHYSEKNKKKLLFDMINDIYMILNSSYFLPSGSSGLSRWIISMIENNNNIFDLKHKCKIPIIGRANWSMTMYKEQWALQQEQKK